MTDQSPKLAAEVDVLADLIARCPEHGTSTETWPECRCAAARKTAAMLAGSVTPADFVTVEYPDGTTRTRLDRLTDGRVMCCLCFEYTTRDRLTPDEEHEGCVTDVCLPCALREAREQAKRAEAELAENTGVLQALRRQRDEAGSAARRVRRLHEPYRFAGDDTTDYCAHCNRISGGWIPWPCDTIRALDNPTP